MQSRGYAACVLLLCMTVSAVAAPGRTISDAERTQVKQALEEGLRFTHEMQRATDIIPIAKKLSRVASRILPGVGIFFQLLGLFLPKDKSLENEMKEGFDRVIAKLDNIEHVLDGILAEIKFAEHKRLLMEFHNKIGLMEKKLKDTVHAPNKDHAITYFKQVYDNEYGEAGTKLVTLIVGQGILQKAAEKSENHRPKMVKFMRTLMSLLLQASTVEVAYEKFNNQQRGVMRNRVSYLSNVSNEMLAVDDKLVKDWKVYFSRDVKRAASNLQHIRGHQEFSTRMYNSLKSKYPWRHWFVLSYAPLWGSNLHLLGCYDCVVEFRYHEHNFVVSSTSSSSQFYQPTLPRNVVCYSSYSQCAASNTKRVYDASQWPSAVMVVMQRDTAWAWEAEDSRVATRDSTLIRLYFRLWMRIGQHWWLKIIYFG